MNLDRFNSLLSKKWGPCILITIVVFLVYVITLSFSTIYTDDSSLVQRDYNFNRHLTNIPQAFQEDIYRSPKGAGYFYRPILRLSFMTDAQFGEKHLIFFSHLTNIILHILACCILLLFLTGVGIPKLPALVFTLLFATHPVNTQVVAVIANRNEELLAIFYLLSCIALIKYFRSNKLLHLLIHLVLFAFALFTKETAVVMPLLYLATVCLVYSWREVVTEWKKYLFIFISWSTMVLTWFMVRVSVLGDAIGNRDYKLLDSISMNLPGVIQAAGKVFLPFNLSTLSSISDTTMAYGVIVILMLTAWFIVRHEKNLKMILFGVLWFLVFAMPGLIKASEQVSVFPENRIYVPMMGFIFIIWGLLGKTEPDTGTPNQKLDNNKSLLVALTLIIIMLSITLTMSRLKYYKNAIAFWGNAVATSPSSSFAHMYLSKIYFMHGDLEKAKNEAESAINIDPSNLQHPHHYLGIVYEKLKDTKKAEKEFKEEIKIDPKYIGAYLDLGNLYYDAGDYIRAREMWHEVLYLDPHNKTAQEKIENK